MLKTCYLHRKVLNNDLNTPLQSSLRTYLFGIGKMLCRQKGRMDDYTDEIPEIAIDPTVENDAEKKSRAWLKYGQSTTDISENNKTGK